MQLTQTFADSDIRPLLQGDRADLELAFTRINTRLRNLFIYRGRRRLRHILSPEDLADAWQEMLRELLKAIRSGRFDPHRELCPWLWTIFIRRAIDNARRNRSYSGLMKRIRERQSPVEDSFPTIFDDEEEKKLQRDRLDRALRDLPARQQTVLQVFLDQFPTTLDKESLRQRVSEASGRAESTASVRRAFQEARRKIRVALRAG